MASRKSAGLKFERFDYNPRCEPEVARADEVKDGIKDATTVLVRQGTAIANEVAYESGDYARSIHGELALDPQRGWVGALVASDYKAHWVEWGWTDKAGGQHPGKHVLQRAVFAAGLRFFEVQK